MTEATIFVHALEKKTPEERAAYLDEACASDAALRQRVEVLLRSHEQAGSFLEKPAVEDAITGDHRPAQGMDSPVAPERLGDYRILREVGRGGMGIVYEAEQVSLGRHVALKVLPRQMLLDARYWQRFEREARAAARLHHSSIVPVIGVGQDEGLHYYVMQFIDGLSLDEVLVELKRAQPCGSRPSLAPRRTGRRGRRGPVASDRLLRPQVPEQDRGGRGRGRPRPCTHGPRAAGPAAAGRTGNNRQPALRDDLVFPCRVLSRTFWSGEGVRLPRRLLANPWPASARRSPRRCSTPTTRGSSTGMSSRATCCSTPAARCG
jgi:hypothetical protein